MTGNDSLSESHPTTDGCSDVRFVCVFVYEVDVVCCILFDAMFIYFKVPFKPLEIFSEGNLSVCGALCWSPHCDNKVVKSVIIISFGVSHIFRNN